MLKEEDGAPRIIIKIAEMDADGDVEKHVAVLDWDTYAARHLGIDLIMHSFDVEARAAITSGMRAHKINEDEIEQILIESDNIKNARRAMR